jgi:RNA polymerase sigma-70 factor, ECF subfamily
LQETFLSVLQSAGSFRGDATGRAWIFAIARHAAWKHVRRAQRTEPAAEPTLESLGRGAGWGTTDAEAMLIEREQRASLAKALAGLAPGDREVLLLRDVEGLSGAEAAHALGIDLTAMKSRLHRARLRLQAVCHRGGSA